MGETDLHLSKMTEETPCKEQAHGLVCSVPTCCSNSSSPLSHPSVPHGMQPAPSQAPIWVLGQH